MEVLGGLAATAFSFAILYMFGVLPWPHDTPLFVVGNLYMAWWCLSLALIIAALSERSEIVEHIWTPLSYIYICRSAASCIWPSGCRWGFGRVH
jgi:capsular polysaccharide transport system permease protein